MRLNPGGHQGGHIGPPLQKASNIFEMNIWDAILEFGNEMNKARGSSLDGRIPPRTASHLTRR